jgi:hypothetical protein
MVNETSTKVDATPPQFAGAIALVGTALHHELTLVFRDIASFEKGALPVLNPWGDLLPESKPSGRERP